MFRLKIMSSIVKVTKLNLHALGLPRCRITAPHLRCFHLFGIPFRPTTESKMVMITNCHIPGGAYLPKSTELLGAIELFLATSWHQSSTGPSTLPECLHCLGHLSMLLLIGVVLTTFSQLQFPSVLIGMHYRFMLLNCFFTN